MTDEAQTVAPKRRGGWTKGKPRKTIGDVKAAPKLSAEEKVIAEQMARMKSRMRARPNWESDDFGVEAGTDVLNIPQETVNALARDGIALEWSTREVRGMEMKRQQRQTASEGWTPVHLSDFDGVLDNGKFLPKGTDEFISVGDCQLVARPMAMHQKAQLQMEREAQEPLDAVRMTVEQGIPNVTGAKHRSVRNQIDVHVDRVQIPD